MRSLGAALVLLLTPVVPAVASPEDDDLATRLFEEGVALRDKDPAQACVKFRASFARNSQPIGTLLNIAQCDEREGKIASALARYAEARDRAREQNITDPSKAPEAEKVAAQHVAKLEPEIPHVSITLAEQLPDMRVVVDGHMVDLGSLTNVAIDPGERSVEVGAPGRVTYRTTVSIKARERKQVAIPPLAKLTSLRRTTGKITVASGAGLVGAGLVLGLVATSRYHAQFGPPPLCNEQTKECESSDASSKAESARTLGTVATVIGVVGLAAVGTGTYLWLRTPPPVSERKVSVRPHVAPGFAGIAAFGRF